MSYRTQNLVRTSAPGWYGLLGFFASTWYLQNFDLPNYSKAAFIVGAMFLVMFAAEAFLCIRGNFGLLTAPCLRSLDVKRVMFKIVGWAFTLLTVMSAYWLFPEYLGNFYTPYYKALALAWPYLIGFFLFCILWEDPRNDQERDGYYWLGYSLSTFRFDVLKNTNLKQHFLAWIVKLYFLPLMFVYLVNYIGFKPQYDTVIGMYDTVFNLIFFIDTAFVCVGYIFANNLTDTNIRSTEPTMLGWVSALVCYQPFWSVIGTSYLSYYGTAWGVWLKDQPLLQIIWAILIILSLLLYIWATIVFGSRFSNLTHRGILMCGPYAYMRHPAYVGKIVSFFLISVPFLGNDVMSVVRHMILWAGLAGIYYLRAKTEEAHLRSIGPEYDIYAKQVTENRKKLFKL